MQRLFDFLVERDIKAAKRAAVGKDLEFLRTFPFSCRKVSPEHPLLRELIISFGAYGYVALFEIEDSRTVDSACDTASVRRRFFLIPLTGFLSPLKPFAI